MNSGPYCVTCGVNHPAKDPCGKLPWHDCFSTVEQHGEDMTFLPCETPSAKCEGCPNYDDNLNIADDNLVIEVVSGEEEEDDVPF